MRRGLASVIAVMGLGAVDAVAVLAAVALYTPCVPQAGRAALVARELIPLDPRSTLVEALRCVVGAARYIRPWIHDVHAERLDRSLVQLMVGHTVESLLAGKANLLGEAAVANGQELVMALDKLCEALAGVDERRGAAEVAPLKRLFKLGTVGPADFVAAFRELRDAHAEVGAPVAEAVLGKRAGVSKADVKELTAQVAAAGPGAPIGASRDPLLWAPDEMSALVGAPFGAAVARLSGGKGSLWSKAKLGVKAIASAKGQPAPAGGGGGGGGGSSGDGAAPPAFRARQMSGTI